VKITLEADKEQLRTIKLFVEQQIECYGPSKMRHVRQWKNILNQINSQLEDDYETNT